MGDDAWLTVESDQVSRYWGPLPAGVGHERKCTLSRQDYQRRSERSGCSDSFLPSWYDLL